MFSAEEDVRGCSMQEWGPTAGTAAWMVIKIFKEEMLVNCYQNAQR